MFDSLTYQNAADTLPNNTPTMAYLAPPLGTFLACSVFPLVAMPISVVYGVTALRCLLTTRMQLTSAVPEESRYVANDFFAVVHRRYVDTTNHKTREEAIVHDDVTKERVRGFMSERQNVWVDDPYNPGVQYMLFLRRRYNEGFLWMRESYWMCLIGDFCQCYIPFCVALLFLKPAVAFTEDMKLVVRHRLAIFDIRHPILNFFRDTKWERPKSKLLPRLRFTGRVL